MNLRLTIILYLAAAFLAHGLLLLNDAHIADGKVLKFYMQKGDLEPYFHMLRASGAYVYVWIHELFGSVSMKFYKIGMFIDIVLNPVLIYVIFRRYSPLKKNHCLFIAFLVLVWPAYHVSVDTTFFPVWFVQTAFYLGWLIFLYQKEKGGNLVLALLAYFFMFVSFNYHACLVYQYLCLGIYFLCQNGYPKNLLAIDCKSRIPKFLKESWILIVLPLLYWGIRQAYMKPFGTKLGYNEFRLFRPSTVEHYFLYVSHIFFDFLKSPFFLEWPVWIALIAVATGVILLSKKILSNKSNLESRIYYRNAILLGIIVVCCLAVPFGGVRKHFELLNLGARHGILAAPFFGVFLVGVVGYLLAIKEGRWARWENLILCQIIVYLIFLDVGLYSSWQARGVKDAAVAAQLKKQEPLPNVSVYLIRDSMPRGRHVYIRSEINVLLFEAWGREEFVGIISQENERQEMIKLTKFYVDLWENQKGWSRVAAAKFNPKGCVGELILLPWQEKKEALAAFKYIYYRMLDKDKLSAFLESMVTVKINPLGFDAKGNPCT
jgi:hypothetical protein